MRVLSPITAQRTQSRSFGAKPYDGGLPRFRMKPAVIGESYTVGKHGNVPVCEISVGVRYQRGSYGYSISRCMATRRYWY